MPRKIPKDLDLARCAYVAYYNPPQVSFEALHHAAQMLWVNAARAVVNGHKSYQRAASLRAEPTAKRTWSKAQREKFMATTRNRKEAER